MNLRSAAGVSEAFSKFQGHKWTTYPSKKKCQVSYGRLQNGGRECDFTLMRATTDERALRRGTIAIEEGFVPALFGKDGIIRDVTSRTGAWIKLDRDTLQVVIHAGASGMEAVFRAKDIVQGMYEKWKKSRKCETKLINKRTQIKRRLTLRDDEEEFPPLRK